MSKSNERVHLRFQAVVIASQLPDNRAEALRVLDYARHMVAEFWDGSSGISDNGSGINETQPLAPLRALDGWTIQWPPKAGSALGRWARRRRAPTAKRPLARRQAG
jgi:hypothetical protein